MIVVGLHHISVNVSDTDRALRFYRDTLGLEPLPRPDFPFGGAWLSTADGRQVHLIETPHVPPDLGQHVAFEVTDLDALVAHLRAAGHDVADPRRVGDTPIRQTFAADPDGNRVEFTASA